MISIAEQYKYANLQMAAEAMFGVPASEATNIGVHATTLGGETFREFLLQGNSHASRFPKSLARQFTADGWQVLAHQPNTTTGFSGTPFLNSKTGERVPGFLRSTGFLDDAARGAEMLRMRESPSTECCA